MRTQLLNYYSRWAIKTERSTTYQASCLLRMAPHLLLLTSLWTSLKIWSCSLRMPSTKIQDQLSFRLLRLPSSPRLSLSMTNRGQILQRNKTTGKWQFKNLLIPHRVKVLPCLHLQVQVLSHSTKRNSMMRTPKYHRMTKLFPRQELLLAPSTWTSTSRRSNQRLTN